MSTDPRINALALPLPEHILRRKYAGDLEGAARAIQLYLQGELPPMLRDRLLCEQEILRRLPTQYPFDRAQALAKLQAMIPAATEEDFDRWELEGRIDFIYIGGEKRYFVRFHRSLAQYADIRRLVGDPLTAEHDWLDPMIRRIREEGQLRCRITLEASLALTGEAFVPGTYLAHLPYPAPCAQQRVIRLLAGDPDGISPESAPARTAWWQRTLTQPQAFQLRYAYDSTIRYADPLHAPAPEQPLYPEAPPPCSDDLSEEGAFIRFTPCLRALAQDITHGESDALHRAWCIYKFITTRVDYTFMRDYFQVENLGEYCAVNLRGDCGLQTLLFINLCRIAGIPARWQSGLSVSPGYTGSHDWAQFYLPGWGWLFADCSFGGDAWRCGSDLRHRFYFGNVEPARMAANRQFQATFTPAMHALRADPYDNQSGEMERIGAETPFTMRQLNGDARLVEIQWF